MCAVERFLGDVLLKHQFAPHQSSALQHERLSEQVFLSRDVF
jgi:hypothetical protein